ncbi:hypothetical protein [Paenibacillus odorifer]|nr:hypothetical protein [Paenibacillus odorifer]
MTFLQYLDDIKKQFGVDDIKPQRQKKYGPTIDKSKLTIIQSVSRIDH